MYENKVQLDRFVDERSLNLKGLCRIASYNKAFVPLKMMFIIKIGVQVENCLSLT